MRLKLYQKVFVWFALNLLLLSVIGTGAIGYLLFKGSNGLLPAHLFSSNIENRFRAISATLQYKPTNTWPDILRQYTGDCNGEYTLYSLEGDVVLPDVPAVPLDVLEAANRIPRMPFTLCPDPSILDRINNMPYGIYEVYGYEDILTGKETLILHDIENIEAGIPPQPRVIYMRTGNPVRYWFGQALFIPDENEDLRYMLLAVSSPSFAGNGLFFDTALIASIMLFVIGIASIWWFPFVRHVTKPLLKMANVAECLAHAECRLESKGDANTNICGLDRRRRDEIGRLAEAIDGMAHQLNGILTGQRLFIQHVAHEINSPLARIKLGLAVLEDRLDGEAGERVGRVMEDVEKLSQTTDDIITFLRSQALDLAPMKEAFDLCPFIMSLVDKEGGNRDIHVTIAEGLQVVCDERYLSRAIRNFLRNAIKYTPADTLITISGSLVGKDRVMITIADCGEGINEQELPLITQPFYCCSAPKNKTGVGLGLSIAHKCIEVCGGTLEFKKNHPSGLLVVITLPGRVMDEYNRKYD